MTNSPALNVILMVLGLIGFSGMVSGLTVKLVGKKLDKSEAKRDEREKARIEEIMILHEGQKCTEHLAEAVAEAQEKEHGPDKAVNNAMDSMCGFKEKRDAFLRLQAAKGIHSTQ